MVPEWVADAQGENTGKTLLDDLQRVKVYFGCSAFLERDALVADFKDACRNTMSADFAGVADRGQGIR